MEREIAKMLADGWRLKEIAAQLQMPQRTLYERVRAIRQTAGRLLAVKPH
jgi:DNA-binding NarL/FixJ family response regulator